MPEYVYPEVLVSTQWVDDHLNDPNIRIVESDEDILLYSIGHIPGAKNVQGHMHQMRMKLLYLLRNYVQYMRTSKA
jgi:3-mercaptopyruvate sulfurtransferase SseA